MIRIVVLIVVFLSPCVVNAEMLMAARTIPSHAIITPEDLQIVDGVESGGFSALESVVGKEARVAIYAGRPVRQVDVVAPALIERNQIVTIAYLSDFLSISVEARALGRGGVGDVLRFMNIDSRTTVTGTVLRDGSIQVKN